MTDYNKYFKFLVYTNGECEIVKVKNPYTDAYGENIEQFSVLFFNSIYQLGELLKSGGKQFVTSLIERLIDFVEFSYSASQYDMLSDIDKLLIKNGWKRGATTVYENKKNGKSTIRLSLRSSK